MDNNLGEKEEHPSNTLEFEIYSVPKTRQKSLDEYEKFLDEVKCCDDMKIDLKVRRTHIQGSYKFDYNIDEEWLIIYCLFELSKANPELVIRVYDDDGEILLIEAADYLPRWLESSKSKGRVYVHQGLVHIIPEHVDIKGMSKQDIVNFISGDSTQTLATRSIQKAIQEQLKGMPDKDSWLKKKFSQLDEIITSSENQTAEHCDDPDEGGAMKPGNLSLASLMAMTEEDLETSPLSSLSSSPN